MLSWFKQKKTNAEIISDLCRKKPNEYILSVSEDLNNISITPCSDKTPGQISINVNKNTENKNIFESILSDLGIVKTTNRILTHNDFKQIYAVLYPKNGWYVVYDNSRNKYKLKYYNKNQESFPEISSLIINPDLNNKFEDLIGSFNITNETASELILRNKLSNQIFTRTTNKNSIGWLICKEGSWQAKYYILKYSDCDNSTYPDITEQIFNNFANSKDKNDKTVYTKLDGNIYIKLSDAEAAELVFPQQSSPQNGGTKRNRKSSQKKIQRKLNPLTIKQHKPFKIR
jgi:ssDNA-specific exonuclease RecJ